MSGAVIGIDAGGTFTDAVVLAHADPVDSDAASGRAARVLGTAKVPTRHDDLRWSLEHAMGAALEAAQQHGCGPNDIGAVALATTLATNALVEGNRAPVALVAVGIEQATLNNAGLNRVLPAEFVLHVDGGHDAHGNELYEIDTAWLAAELERVESQVEAFAVAAHFSVRNSAHETAAADLVEQLTNKPVTLSHRLSAELNGPRRAVTATVNASLLPVIAHLVEAADLATATVGVRNRLMVVRGDGSLVAGDFIAHRPVEAVASGPAASFVGAGWLSQGAGEADAVIVADVGGTTTDVAVARGIGDPAGALTPASDGAQVGTHRLAVRTVPFRTVGLGGDSEVAEPAGAAVIDGTAGSAPVLELGPRRVAPLCTAALRGSERAIPQPAEERAADEEAGARAVDLLSKQLAEENSHRLHGVLADVGDGELVALADVATTALELNRLRSLHAAGEATLYGFTPTDACVVLGVLEHPGAEAAQLGAQLLARRLAPTAKPLAGMIGSKKAAAGGRAADGTAGEAAASANPLRQGGETAAKAAARSVFDQFVAGLADACLAVGLVGDGLGASELNRPWARTALERQAKYGWRPAAEHYATQAAEQHADAPAEGQAGAQAGGQAGERPVTRLHLGLSVPLLAVGAPAVSIAEPLTRLLGTTSAVPEFSEVAGALGAAVAPIRVERTATITAPRRGTFRLHWLDRAETFHSLEEAAAQAEQLTGDAARADAVAAGADEPHIAVHRHDKGATVEGRELFTESRITAVATAWLSELAS